MSWYLFNAATTGWSTPIIVATRWTTRLYSGSGSASVRGLPSASLVFSNSPRVHRASPSTASRTCKAQTVRVGSRLRSRVTRRSCQRVIRASTGWTCPRTRIMRAWSRSWLWLLSMYSSSLGLNPLLTILLQGNGWIRSGIIVLRMDCFTYISRALLFSPAVRLRPDILFLSVSKHHSMRNLLFCKVCIAPVFYSF